MTWRSALSEWSVAPGDRGNANQSVLQFLTMGVIPHPQSPQTALSVAPAPTALLENLPGGGL